MNNKLGRIASISKILRINILGRSDNPSSNPAKVYNFYVEIVVEKIENKEKVAGIVKFLKNN